VLTPHPLEAARLWGRTTAEVQAARLDCAQALANELGCVVVLKGSGTVITAPGRVPVLNPSGNARLGTAGTGDVLAGMLGAAWAPLAVASDDLGFEAVCAAVFQHGWLADQWDEAQNGALTAGRLAARVTAF
jgi:NAD(P)H-hydrate repair Nnr-like enzyme with NAD(P)H-hydrate dehydratase domain